MKGLKPKQWIAVSLAVLLVVLLYNAPRTIEVMEVSNEVASPPTTENTIDSALMLIAGSQPMQGILLLRQVAEDQPSNFRAQYHLGRFSAQTGQWEKVLERFEKVRSIDPEFIETNYWIGSAAFNLGQNEKAKESLERYLQADENNIQLRNEAETMLNQIK